MTLFTKEDEMGSRAVPCQGGQGRYAEAVAIVVGSRNASTSHLQRRMLTDYNLAASLIERMEAEGVVSRPDACGKRTVLAPVKPITSDEPSTGRLVTQDPPALPEREAVARALYETLFACGFDEDELGRTITPPTWEVWKAERDAHRSGWVQRVYEAADAVLSALPPSSGGER